VSLSVLERERKFASAWVPIGIKGTPLDAAHVKEMQAKHADLQEKARQRVLEATGGAVTNPKSNTEVPPFLAAAGYDLPLSAKTGKPGAAKGVLEPLAAAGDQLCKDILEYRQHDTARGLLLNPWAELCDRGDSRIRSNIMSIEARTGRTSSRDFNMQQVSRQGGMRACITSESDDHCIISADFNSVEIRVGAALSGDLQMQYLIAELDARTDCFNSMMSLAKNDEEKAAAKSWYEGQKREFDFHWRTAIACYGPEAVKENRYNAKRVNFAKMFGSGKRSCSKLVGIPESEVSKAFDAFSSVAPQYEAWDREMRNYVHNGGRSYELYSGRVAWMDPTAEHGAGNTAIQGTARELAVDATLNWLDGKWAYATLLIVHDELVAFNIPREQAEDATRYLIECMECEVRGVKIRAESNKPSREWQDAS
jgi:DNA polymerase I-like protein with 3'-5' exonuclease and polymerase domains